MLQNFHKNTRTEINNLPSSSTEDRLSGYQNGHYIFTYKISETYFSSRQLATFNSYCLWDFVLKYEIDRGRTSTLHLLLRVSPHYGRDSDSRRHLHSHRRQNLKPYTTLTTPTDISILCVWFWICQELSALL
jgi:hypothetical protein